MQPNRHSQRKKGYDYTEPGYYAITLCTYNRVCLFGVIVDGDMRFNDAGRMIHQTWHEAPNHHPGIELDVSQTMPNHLHGIVVVRDLSDPHANPHHGTKNGRTQRSAPTSVSTVIQRFKTLTTKRYIEGVKTARWPVFHHKLWQRNFHDRIIRNETELNRIRSYIDNNPAQWASDENNIA